MSKNENIVKQYKNSQKTEDSSLITEENYEHGKHPNSLANLKPFEKGVSGNPGGRPDKFSKLKIALDKWADSKASSYYWDEPPKEATTMKEQVHWRIWDKARQGNIRCIEILAKLGCLDDE